MTAISTAISLATADAIQDPYLVWAFAVPSMIGFVASFVFYFIFRHLDHEEFFVHLDDTNMADQRAIKHRGAKVDEEGSHHGGNSSDEKTGAA